MLSDHTQLLLSAYVDGALTPQERDSAERLLRKSAEARLLVKKLGDNIQKVKGVSRKSLGGNFPNQVLMRVASVMAAPQIAPPAPAAFKPARPLVKKPRLRHGMPTWAVGAIAASVVGGIVIGGAIWLRGQLEHNPGGPAPISVVAQNPLHAEEEPKNETPITPNPVDQLIGKVVRGAGERYGENQPDIVAAPKSEPVRFAFGDLQQQKALDILKWELTHSSDAQNGVHLDVTVKYNARSLSRIVESFHNHGVQLVVTPPAESSLAKNLPLLIYAENIQADQLALALKDLSEIDIQGKRQQASTFEAVRVSRGSVEDYTRIAQGLGIDPKQLKAPAAPVWQVSALGVVLPADRPKNPAAVNEIRGFLAGRGPVQIGALHVFLYLEPTGK